QREVGGADDGGTAGVVERAADRQAAAAVVAELRIQPEEAGVGEAAVNRERGVAVQLDGAAVAEAAGEVQRRGVRQFEEPGVAGEGGGAAGELQGCRVAGGAIQLEVR